MSTEIKTNQLVVPPVTLDDVLSTIASVEHFTAEEGINGRNLLLTDMSDPTSFLRVGDPNLQRVMVCVIVCHNGHRVVGTAIAQDESTHDVESGRKAAYNDALNKLFPSVVFARREAAAAEVASQRKIREFLLANFGRGLHELRPEELSTYMRALFAANPETSKEQHRWNVECAVQMIEYLLNEISQLKTSDGVNANRVSALREQIEDLQKVRPGLVEGGSDAAAPGYCVYELTLDDNTGDVLERLHVKSYPTLNDAYAVYAAPGSRYDGVDYYCGFAWHYDVHLTIERASLVKLEWDIDSSRWKWKLTQKGIEECSSSK